MTRVRQSHHLKNLVEVGQGLARRGYRDWGQELEQRLAWVGDGRPEGESQEAKQEMGADLQKGKARIPLGERRRGGLEHPHSGASFG